MAVCACLVLTVLFLIVRLANNMYVSIVILAAGAARRMGRLKQLLMLDGKPLVWRTAAAACAAAVNEVLVVTGALSDAVTDGLADLPVRAVYNPEWCQGQSTSVRAGVEALNPHTQAVIFLPADQPLVTPDLLQQLNERYLATGSSIVAPIVAGRLSSPVLFDVSVWRQSLLSLSGDKGGRSILVSHPEAVVMLDVLDVEQLLDADTPQDFDQIQALWLERQRRQN